MDASIRAAVLEFEVERLRVIGRMLITYARWQIDEGQEHHPTLPSAVAQAEAAFGRSARTDSGAANAGGGGAGDPSRMGTIARLRGPIQ